MAMAAVVTKFNWADLEDSPTSGGASSSAVRARWADLAESEEDEVAAPEPQELAQAEPVEADCRAASRELDADSDCSTSAEDGLGEVEVASDEEGAMQELQEESAVEKLAEAAAGEWSRPARRRDGRSDGRASNMRGAASAAAAAAQPRRGGWKDVGSSSSGQWGRHQRGVWQSGKESWAAQGRWDSRKDGSWQQPRGRGGRHQGAASGSGKRQCQFTIGIEEEPCFRVVRRLLGSHGKHVKRIAEESGAKLRLRGRGSGFQEGPEQEESSDPLMLCVSAPDGRSYDIAVRLLREHLEDIYREHRVAFPGSACPKVDLHEGAREGSF